MPKLRLNYLKGAQMSEKKYRKHSPELKVTELRKKSWEAFQKGMVPQQIFA
jgi:hypothetical protein